jgi:alkylhydroperoxidase/carboxymuconolactone decarboxylase family protein YurZ
MSNVPGCGGEQKEDAKADPHDWVNDRSMRKLRELQPQLFEKFVDFERAVYEPRKLSRKVKELIAVAVPM